MEGEREAALPELEWDLGIWNSESLGSGHPNTFVWRLASLSNGTALLLLRILAVGLL